MNERGEEGSTELTGRGRPAEAEEHEGAAEIEAELTQAVEAAGEEVGRKPGAEDTKYDMWEPQFSSHSLCQNSLEQIPGDLNNLASFVQAAMERRNQLGFAGEHISKVRGARRNNGDALASFPSPNNSDSGAGTLGLMA